MKVKLNIYLDVSRIIGNFHFFSASLSISGA